MARAKKDIEKTAIELILTGHPGEDFTSFLKSREKPYDYGLKLIRKYTKNQALYKFLADAGASPASRKIMLTNIKVIARKWLIK
jgi:hypothetical protein